MNEDGNDSVHVLTKHCMLCGEQDLILVDADGYDRWVAGTNIQFAFPELSKEVREQLISGTHDECWQKMFGEGAE